MRRGAAAPVLALAVVGGVAACGSSNNSSTPTTVVATGSGKATAFCGYWGTFETDTANLSSSAQATQFAQSTTGAAVFANLSTTVPSGAIGSDARSYITSFETNANFNVTLLNDGTAVDAYCGVEGNGTPLPADFGDGASKAVCKNFLPVYAAVSDATVANNPGPQVVAALRNHSSQLANFTAETSELPSNLQAAGQSVAAKANQVKSSGNASVILNGSGNGSGGAAMIAFYCGQDN